MTFTIQLTYNRITDRDTLFHGVEGLVRVHTHLPLGGVTTVADGGGRELSPFETDLCPFEKAVF